MVSTGERRLPRREHGSVGIFPTLGPRDPGLRTGNVPNWFRLERSNRVDQFSFKRLKTERCRISELAVRFPLNYPPPGQWK